MTDWIQSAKKNAQQRHERAILNQRTLQVHAGRLWERLFTLASKAVGEFNEDGRLVSFLPTDPNPGFVVEIIGTKKEVLVNLDYDHALIGYAYLGITDAEGGKFYLEANPDGSLLLICLGVPCDKSIKEEEAVRRILEPLFRAVA